MRTTPLVSQLGKFALVGVSNTALSFAVYGTLLALGTPAPPAASLAFVAGAFNGYLWNGRWTFAARSDRGALLRYGAVQLAGLAATDGLVWLLGSGGLDHLSAYALTVCIVTCSTFVASRRWVFRPAAAR
jgi:putative flippase GtrA